MNVKKSLVAAGSVATGLFLLGAANFGFMSRAPIPESPPAIVQHVQNIHAPQSDMLVPKPYPALLRNDSAGILQNESGNASGQETTETSAQVHIQNIDVYVDRMDSPNKAPQTYMMDILPGGDFTTGDTICCTVPLFNDSNHIYSVDYVFGPLNQGIAIATDSVKPALPYVLMPGSGLDLNLSMLVQQNWPFSGQLKLSILEVELPQVPPAGWDEQLLNILSGSYTSLSYVFTAGQLMQTDPYGYGPAVLVNAVTDNGYWDQIGCAWNWTPRTGFEVVYAQFSPNGTVMRPYPGTQESDVLHFSRPVRSGDTIDLSLSFKGSKVLAFAYDEETGSCVSVFYDADGATKFFDYSENGFFTGPMVEWWHMNAYEGPIWPIIIKPGPDFMPSGFAPSLLADEQYYLKFLDWQYANGPTGSNYFIGNSVNATTRNQTLELPGTSEEVMPDGTFVVGQP